MMSELIAAAVGAGIGFAGTYLLYAVQVRERRNSEQCKLMLQWIGLVRSIEHITERSRLEEICCQLQYLSAAICVGDSSAASSGVPAWTTEVVSLIHCKIIKLDPQLQSATDGAQLLEHVGNSIEYEDNEHVFCEYANSMQAKCAEKYAITFYDSEGL